MYLDPGFGSMIVQIFVAALAGFSFLAFALRDKIRSLFTRFTRKKQELKDDGENNEGIEHDS